MCSLFIKDLHISPIGLGIALYALYLSGCSLPLQSSDSHQQDHGGIESAAPLEHDHEEDRESISIWTDILELVAEYPPLVAGQSQTMLLHLTYIQTGLPVKDVPIVYSLATDSEQERMEGQATPLRPGIYTIAPLFSSSGDWQLLLDIPVNGGSARIGIEALEVHIPGEMHAHEHNRDHAASNAISFTKEQQWMGPVATTPAIRGTITERYRLPARVLRTADSFAVATASMGGMVRVADTDAFPKIGDTVSAGQVLAILDVAELSTESLAMEENRRGLQTLRTDLGTRAAEADGEVERARTQLMQQERELQRAEELLAVKAVAQRDVDMLRSAVSEARASLTAAERVATQVKQSLQTTDPAPEKHFPRTASISSPISGMITQIYVHPGIRMETGQPAFEIVNADQVLMEVRIPESLLPVIATPPLGLLEMPGNEKILMPLTAGTDETTSWMLPVVDPETRTAASVFRVQNDAMRLPLGMSMQAWLDGRTEKDAIQIPLSSVIDENGIAVVYVMLTGESFEQRRVRLGIADGERVAVMEGIMEGERVASQGAYLVRLAGLAGTSLGSAHVH